MEKGIEKMLVNFDHTNRPKVIHSLMTHFDMRHEQAEGIWQDAWLVVLTRISEHPDTGLPDNLPGFMWGICRNKAMEYGRERANRYDTDSLDEAEIEGLPRLDREASEWAQENDRSHLCELRRLALLDRALATLPDKQRRLVRGYYYDGKSMRQLASELGFKDETVAKSTKLRAIRTMQEVVRNHNLLHVYGVRLCPALPTARELSLEGITYGKVPA